MAHGRPVRRDQGIGHAWVLTITHRRAVDWVGPPSPVPTGNGASRRRAWTPPYDDGVEEVTTSLEQQQVRRCLQALTDLQPEVITLAYFDGYTYREVAEKLHTALPTIKSRMRDGLIRMRDCLGVGIGLAAEQGR